MSIPSKRVVAKSYQRQYNDPITFIKGDSVQITKSDLWDGVYTWLWCINEAQKEGWVPASYLARDGDNGYALRDYNAWELTVDEGETIIVFETESGWYWCENAHGERGWIPANCFEAEGHSTTD